MKIEPNNLRLVKICCNRGEEITFGYKGIQYHIDHWCDGPNISVTASDGKQYVFKNYKELINNFVIDGLKFKHFIHQVDYFDCV